MPIHREAGNLIGNFGPNTKKRVALPNLLLIVPGSKL